MVAALPTAGFGPQGDAFDANRGVVLGGLAAAGQALGNVAYRWVNRHGPQTYQYHQQRAQGVEELRRILEGPPPRNPNYGREVFTIAPARRVFDTSLRDDFASIPNRQWERLVSVVRAGKSTGMAMALRRRMRQPQSAGTTTVTVKRAVNGKRARYKKGRSRTNVGLYRSPLYTGSSGREKNFFDTQGGGLTVLNNTWYNYINCLTIIPQDASSTGRTGRKITVKSLYIRSVMHYAPVAGSHSTSQMRVVVGYDRQCNGTAAVATDVFDAAASFTVHQYRNLGNSARFVILHDQIYEFRSSTNDAVAGDPSPVDKFITLYKKLNSPIVYAIGGTTGVLTQHESGNFFVLVTSRVIAGTVSMTEMTCRVRYDTL